MVKYYCDGCGKEMDSDTGVVGESEITLERPNGKVSVHISVDNMFFDRHEAIHPSLCFECLELAFHEHNERVKQI